MKLCIKFTVLPFQLVQENGLITVYISIHRKLHIYLSTKNPIK